MENIINHVTAFLPVYRILNREENLRFFCDVLGFKVLIEEGAMVRLGGHEAKIERLLLEESPGFVPVADQKKHARTVIELAEEDIEQLLARHLDQVAHVYQTSSGYAFEAVSPENDVFLLTSETLSNLTEVAKDSVKFDRNPDFRGVADFKATVLDLNVSTAAALNFYEKSFAALENNSLALPFVKLNFTTQADFSDLVEDALDLEALLFKLSPDFDLGAFAARFEGATTYLDGAEKVFSLEIPQHLSLWFAK